MIIAFLKKHIVLTGAILFFIASILIWNFYEYHRDEASKDTYTTSVSEKINDLCKKLSLRSKTIKSLVLEKEIVAFSYLNSPYQYPCYIFKNKALAYWSDYRLYPNYETIKGDYVSKVISLRNGKFLVYKESFSGNNGNNYEVVFLVPLQETYDIENNYLHSGLNTSLLGNEDVKISLFTSGENYNIYNTQKELLFSIVFPEHENIRSDSFYLLLIGFTSVGILLLVLYGIGITIALKRRGKTDYSFLFLFAFLAAVRIIMLLFNYPFFLIEFDLFNPKYFASSSVSPSLGDLLLNCLVVLIFSIYFFNNYSSSVIIRRLMKVSSLGSQILSLIFLVLIFFGLHEVFNLLKAISMHSPWSLDITSSVEFNLFRVICLLVFVIISILYFLYSHIFYRLFIYYNKKSVSTALFLFVIAITIYTVVKSVTGQFYIVIFLLNVAYFTAVYFSYLPRFFAQFKYATYVYFLLCAFVCSLAGAYSIYQVNYEKSVINKQKFASQILVDNDILGEFLLDEASRSIRQDAFIKNKLLTPLSSKDVIEQKIKKIFLSNYFDKYDVTVTVYDGNGNAYDSEASFPTYELAIENLKKGEVKTDYEGIYLLKETPKDSYRKYLSFNTIEKNNTIIGFIVVELKHRRIIPNSVYPELLVDKKFLQHEENRNYNYAVYSDSSLLYSYGNYNYDRDFIVSDLNNNKIFTEGVFHEGFHHLAIEGRDGKKIVISSVIYHFNDLFSNFSFLYLILILFIIKFVIFFTAVNYRSNTTSLSGKIQIYLNLAFFLPLLIVSVVTVSIISASYKDNLSKTFIKKAESISSNLSLFLEGYKKEGSRKEKLENAVMQMAQYTELDINIFSGKGRLLYSSQPAIYSSGLLSGLINPAAYSTILERRMNTVMLTESVGKLNYNVVYVAIRSLETGELMGILSIPFFESKQEIEKQVINVLTTIINIFVSIFMVFLGLSYFASHILTTPLKIITQRIKKTTLGDNEPLEWKTKDEIGLLVGEYNEMLVKLEESKNALSRSEKESAWREMAKQVAHEIKNPLTPMKLTIQHLQRRIKEKSVAEGEEVLTQKNLQTLLDQVENLSEIATSFSVFAKMPIPKSEKIDVSAILESTIRLHNNNNSAVVEAFIEPGRYFIIGDEQIMHGCFTNLIINAIQSVPFDKIAQVQVCLKKKDKDFILITVSDNGTGIPESIRDKVFLPNFSTKYNGSGIGLAVAKRGVEHAGGKIWFESFDSGTTFFIELPIVQD
ncbi:MAG: ATP-binding protein [Cytophagaceae bacterium]